MTAGDAHRVWFPEMVERLRDNSGFSGILPGALDCLGCEVLQELSVVLLDLFRPLEPPTTEPQAKVGGEAHCTLTGVGAHTLRVELADGSHQTIDFTRVVAGELSGPFQLGVWTYTNVLCIERSPKHLNSKTPHAGALP